MTELKLKNNPEKIIRLNCAAGRLNSEFRDLELFMSKRADHNIRDALSSAETESAKSAQVKRFFYRFENAPG